MKPRENAQVSLEYLLLAAVLLSTMAFLMPSITAFYNASVFAIETKKASAFLQNLASKAEKINLFEEASTESIQAFPNSTEWKLSAENNKLVLEVESKGLEKTKTLSQETRASFESFEQAFSKSLEIRLKKQGGKILIINS